MVFINRTEYKFINKLIVCNSSEHKEIFKKHENCGSLNFAKFRLHFV